MQYAKLSVDQNSRLGPIFKSAPTLTSTFAPVYSHSFEPRSGFDEVLTFPMRLCDREALDIIDTLEGLSIHPIQNEDDSLPQIGNMLEPPRRTVSQSSSHG
jgi:hypothetical protein